MSIWKDNAGGLHDDMGGAALTMACWPQGMTKLSDDEAHTLQNPPASLSSQWEAYQAAAAVQLDENDRVALRCWKAGVSYPTEWHAYDVALRAIMSQEQPAKIPPKLPDRPASYPAGT